jgi:AmmeMemoRadiSam system protein B/AmmeMemoRadiSam system protein A
MEHEGLGVSGVREPFAGRVGFYPKTANELAAQIDFLLSSAPEEDIAGTIIGCLVPHAGYAYSGEMAARVYRQLVGKSFDLVFIFGPPHRAYRQEPTFDTASAYLTPLGTVPVDQDTIARLVSESPLFSISRHPHVQEHSIEVQIPFLQTVLEPGFAIAPAVVGELTLEQLQKAAEFLARIAREKKTLFIASSDLSHYFRYEQAVEMDRLAMDLIKEYDYELLYRKLMMGETEMCGGYGTILVMLTARLLGATEARELGYTNSGDVTGDRSSVVGYGAAVFVAPEDARTKLKGEKWLDEQEQKELLDLARSHLRAVLANEPEAPYLPIHEKLTMKRGAFVTLKTRDGRLRGCIGHILADRPLYEVVKDMARAAATQDPRFAPVSLRELDDLVIEISVLSELEPLASTAEIEIGRHGLLVQKGPLSGLLLPQVAVEWNFTPEEFLRQTFIKAGMSPEEARDPETRVWKFTAQVFSEDEFSGEGKADEKT